MSGMQVFYPLGHKRAMFPIICNNFINLKEYLVCPGILSEKRECENCGGAGRADWQMKLFVVGD